MSEMVERVAEALMRKIHRNQELTMFGQAEDVKENWRVLARAAIEAMREPTDNMPFPESVKQYWRAMIEEALK